jgi:hypothetical protein
VVLEVLVAVDKVDNLAISVHKLLVFQVPQAPVAVAVVEEVVQ